jgi:hypothetical protein
MGRSAGQSEWSPELNREDCEQRGRELGVVGSRLMVAVAGCVSRCDFEGGVSSCPSQDAVGEMLGGVRRESVNRAVRLLQESGQLAVRKTRAPGARWPHNEYTLLWAARCGSIGCRCCCGGSLAGSGSGLSSGGWRIVRRVVVCRGAVLALPEVPLAVLG